MARDYAKTANPRGRPKTPPARNWRWPLAGILILLFVLAIFYLKQQSDRAARENNEEGGVIQRTLQSTAASTKTPTPLGKTTVNALEQTRAAPAAPQPKFDFYTELPKGQSAGATVKPVTAAPAPVRALTPVNSAASDQLTPTPRASSTSIALQQKTSASPAEPAQTETNTLDTADLTAIELKKLTNHASSATKKNMVPTPYLVQLGVFRNYAAVDQLKAQLIMQGFNVNVKAFKKSSGLYRVYLGPFATLGEAKQQQAQLDKNQIKNKLVKDLP